MRSVFSAAALFLTFIAAANGLTALWGQEPAADPAKPDPAKPQTGKFTLRFTERSELSDPAKINERVRIIAQARPDELAYDISREDFSLYVPETYDGSLEHGLFVWINSGEGGDIKEG